jgi:hypothetical protein
MIYYDVRSRTGSHLSITLLIFVGHVDTATKSERAVLSQKCFLTLLPLSAFLSYVIFCISIYIAVDVLYVSTGLVRDMDKIQGRSSSVSSMAFSTFASDQAKSRPVVVCVSLGKVSTGITP